MFEYEIDRGKRKNVYILIKSGKVLVRVPKRFPEYKINSILISRIKTIRIYNFLRSKGIASKNALLIALTYNSVIKNDEYKMLEEVVNSLEGGN